MPSLRGLVLPFLALATVLLTALYIVDIVRTNSHASGCEMTYSWPVYTPLQQLKDLPVHRKYSLHAVHMHNARDQLTGMPLLFVPGHMGSYKQSRSIARHLWDLDKDRFDVFAVDFQEEATGLNGRFVEEQATYVNDAVRAILKHYQKQIRQQNKGVAASKKRTPPESVVIVAHSMGGVVVRVAELLPNFKRNSIQHVVSFGTPYEKPPFPYDADAQAVYSRIDAEIASWKINPLSSTVYVSISGGHKDTTIHASLSLTDRVISPASPALGVAVLAPKLPQVGVTIDHLCLLWCHQLLRRVAVSLDAIIDRDTRSLIRDEEKRLEITRAHLLHGSYGGHDDSVLDSHSASHRQALLEGYHSTEEFTAYGLLLPQYVVRVLRARGMSLLWMMNVIVAHIFFLQLNHWQRRFDLQGGPPSAAAPATLNPEHFPSFTSLLHPASHAPGFIKTAIAFVDAKATSPDGKKRPVILGGLVAVTAVVIGVVVELSRQYEQVNSVTSEVIVLAILYGAALGHLYLLAFLLSLVRVLVQPLVRVALAIVRRTRTKRWFVITVVYFFVQLVGHVRDFELLALDSAPRHLALLALGSIVVFLLHLVELGVKLEHITADQQRYRASLVALLSLSLVSWVGKVEFLLDVVRFPPPQLTNDLLGFVALAISTLALFRYFITATDAEMAPLPPTAFFDNADGGADDDGAAAGKITAENCPRCVFEDGGPGAVFIEYQSPVETRKLRCKGNELVVFGPTFRVVSCDCVLRFQTTREYCDFCTRSCRLCGGGSGNYAQAQKYREFLDQSKTEVAMHSLVALSFELAALVLLASQKEHYISYTTPTLVLILVLYHGMLRHPVEANRLKKEQRKQQKKADIASGVAKKKPKKKSAASRRRTAQSSTTSSATSSTKPKKQAASSSSSSSSFSLMEEYGGSESVH